MNVAEAIRAACAVGVTIEVDGPDLILQAPSPPSKDIIDGLSRHKLAIVELLRPASGCWSSEDWRRYFDGRIQHARSKGLSLAAARTRAFACCIPEWLNRHWASSMPGHCVACGKGDRADDRVWPFGTEIRGHAWLHSDCWFEWHQRRLANAVAALSAMGIDAAGDAPNSLKAMHLNQKSHGNSENPAG